MADSEGTLGSTEVLAKPYTTLQRPSSLSSPTPYSSSSVEPATISDPRDIDSDTLVKRDKFYFIHILI